MRLIMVIVECVDFEYLLSQRPPNIMSLGPHPAVSFGRTSRSAIAALLGGFLPTCKFSDCFHRRIHLFNPFFLSNAISKCGKQNVLLYVPNGWAMELIKPYTPNRVWRMLVAQNKDGFDSQELIDDFLNHEPPSDFLAYFHMMETHPPFFEGTVPRKPEDLKILRAEALRQVDKMITPLLEVDDTTVVVASDHNLHHEAENMTAESLDVFLATRGQFPMLEGTIAVHPFKVADISNS